MYPVKSWLDAFVQGDVYVLGFGFDLAEFDLWWLLNRKCQEKAAVGKVHFYEPQNPKNQEKQFLLHALGVQTHDLGIAEQEGCYQQFYKLALEDIAKMKNKERLTCV